MSIDTKSLRKYIDRHGPPLSPMLIFTLLDEIDRYQAVVDAVRALADEAREWGRGNPEVLFFEQDIRAVLDADAEEDRL